MKVNRHLLKEPLMRMERKRIQDARDAILFVGSMLSCDTESRLPSGAAISSGLLDRVLSDCLETSGWPSIDQLDAGRVKRAVKATPFEVVFDGHPEPDKVSNYLSSVCRSATFNRFHLEIADAISAGRIRSVITTNYDVCIEQSFYVRFGVKLPTILSEADCTRLGSSGEPFCLFKIHGCCSKPETMVFQLSQEGVLPRWKRDLVAQMIQGRDVFVIGYSALDFDICPALLKLSCNNLYWLMAPAENQEEMLARSSPNIRVVRRNPVLYLSFCAVPGGFDSFFDIETRGLKAFEPADDGLVGKIVEAVIPAARRGDTSYLLWKGHLLGSVSFKHGMEGARKQIPSSEADLPEVNRFVSDIGEASGRYFDSLKPIARARQAYLCAEAWSAWLETFVVEVSRYSAARDPFNVRRARMRLTAAIGSLNDRGMMIPERFAHDETCCRLMEMKSWRRILGRAYFFKLVEKQEVIEALKFFILKGSWGAFQVFRSDATIVGISTDEIEGDYFLLNAIDGFGHLNTFVGRTAAYRRVGSTQPEDADEVLATLAALGHDVELWKFFLKFHSKFGMSVRRRYRLLARKSLRRCQFFWPVRLYYMINFEYRVFIEGLASLWKHRDFEQDGDRFSRGGRSS